MSNATGAPKPSLSSELPDPASGPVGFAASRRLTGGQLQRATGTRAPFAANPAMSRGRLISEPRCPTRSDFQRDRDRIVHSSAFRRLTHKTQVFIYHEGDHYRSRLTHSLEVAQIARAIARQLRLDEDLAEAIALAHDLGHPPFGHAGERALNDEMRDFGGFDHNAQSLKVVTSLERKYAGFDGLNLTFETLEGIVKHNGPATSHDVHQSILDYCLKHDLELNTHTSAEAQAAAIADDIAYNNHDLDDGLRAGLISLNMLEDVAITEEFLAEVRAIGGDHLGRREIYEVNRRLITAMVVDVVDEARQRIEKADPKSMSDVRGYGQPLVTFSVSMHGRLAELRSFLFQAVYRNERVMRIMTDAEGVVRELFRFYLATPTALPEAWAHVAANASLERRAGLICDYVAGMTDRFAIQEHRRLFDATPQLR